MTYHIKKICPKNILYIFILTLLNIFCVLILTTCSVNNKNSSYDRFCLINKVDNLKYFNFFNKSLSPLTIPKNLYDTLSLPEFGIDYNIPVMIDSKQNCYNGDNIQISICPPILLEDKFDELCVTDIN